MFICCSGARPATFSAVTNLPRRLLAACTSSRTITLAGRSLPGPQAAALYLVRAQRAPMVDRSVRQLDRA
jgi:hypothetical protein